MRLIDADELKAVLDGYYYPEYGEPNFSLSFLNNDIDSMPTAEAIPKDKIKNVIKQLEDKREEWDNKWNESICTGRSLLGERSIYSMEAYNHAIEILKEVIEWQ